MLVLSDQAFQALEAAQEEKFVVEMTRILGEEMPEDAREMGWDGVIALVRRTLQRAKAWDISDEEALGQLCAMALGFGEDMLDEPEIAGYLTGGGDVAARISALMDEIDAIG